MIPRPLQRLLFATAALAAAASTPACPRNADPALAGPSVGQDLVVNGLPVQVQQVSAAEAAAPLVERVAQHWKAEGFDVKQRTLGAWQLVSALSDEGLSTLQLADRGKGAVGLFAIGQPAALGRKAGRSVALPPGAQVVSTVASRDGPRAGTTTTLSTMATVAETAAFFKRSLAENGWQSVKTLGLQNVNGEATRATVNAQRGGELVQIVIFPHAGKVAAVVNRADAP